MAELDQERIAAAALAVADERGVTGFTMRAVAESLGVTPMALYHHVADKAALVELVIEAAISERPLPTATGVWQDDLWEFAHWVRQGAQAHPAATHLARVHQAWTPTMLPTTERWIGIWQQSGLPLDQALEAATVSSLAIYGYVDAESRLHLMKPPDEAILSWLPNTRLLFTSEHDPEAEFELMVRALIEGTHARLSRHTDPSDGTGNPPRDPRVGPAADR
jgi:AcrR family transcriptional regulator